MYYHNKENEKYETCDYYNDQGNEAVVELFDKVFRHYTKYYNEPIDRHSVYDLAMYLPDIRTHCYIEVKFKFNDVIFENYTIVEKDKMDKIEEFMKDKDKSVHKFLFASYYVKQGKWVVYNIERNDYQTFEVKTSNSTANDTDVKPYMRTKVLCKLPFYEAKVYDIPSSVKVKYSGDTWQYGNKIEE